MKILVIHCAYLYKGGEDYVVQQEIDLLKQNAHDVRLLLFTNEGNQLLKLLQLPFNIISYKKTRQEIKAFQPEVIHIHNLHFAASPSILYACKHENIPVVMTMHNYRLLCPSATLYMNGNLFLNYLKENFPITAIKKGV